MRFGIWLPVYGGWLRSRDSAPGTDIDACIQTAILAEAAGYDFLYASENLLNPIHGPEARVIDAWSLLAAIAPMTLRIGLCGAVKPGFRPVTQMARMVDTVAQLARRPVSLSVVCGWWQEEFDRAGVEWLDHAGRYDRAEAFADRLLAGFDDAEGGIDPAHRPKIWLAGQSARATAMAARIGDCLFLNGMSDDVLAEQIGRMREAAARQGREVEIAINAHVMAAPSVAAAQARVERLIARRDQASIAYFREVMAQSGADSWKALGDAEMVDSNAGFAAGLIGDPPALKTRLRQLAALGVTRVLCQFDDPVADAAAFMTQVVKPLREMRAELESGP
ncbi:LLM class flavin-dependent oxidoreductase [Halovulum sp. GXIMD14794]